LINRLDDGDWLKENELLVRFLGLQQAEVNAVSSLVERIAQASNPGRTRQIMPPGGGAQVP
jgi:hypothetical protein